VDPAAISFGGSDNGDSSNIEPSQAEPQEDLSLASPFLAKIPAQDREVVGRYVKDWDAGVTKKFQDYSGRLKPYENLGVPIEELQKYINLARNFQADPENVFRIMWNGLQEQYGDGFDQELARILQLEAEDMSDDQEFYAGGDYEEPDPNEIFQQNVSQELEEFREWRQNLEAQQQSAEENAQLDNVLDMMHNRFGDFDDNWVLVRLAEHGNVQQAMQEWKQMLGKYNQTGAQRQAPKVLGGQGGVPVDQVNAKKLRGQDRRNAVMAALEGLGE
jgi:DNA-binding transcriptional MerR regulator